MDMNINSIAEYPAVCKVQPGTLCMFLTLATRNKKIELFLTSKKQGLSYQQHWSVMQCVSYSS